MPLIEPTKDGHNGSSVPPRPSVSASEETISVERDVPRTLDIISPKVNSSANAAIAPLTADTPNSQSTQGASGPTVLASGPVPSVGNYVTEEAHIKPENVQHSDAVEANVRPVELVTETADSDERPHVESTGEPSNVVMVDVADNGSREDLEGVGTRSIPETVALVAATPAGQRAVVAAVDDEAFQSVVEEPRVAKQPSQQASSDPVAAFTVESVGGQEIDDLSPASVAEAISIEMGAQLESHSMTPVVNEVEEAQEVAEHMEIPTPAPEHMVFVEETPGQDVSADVCGHAGAVQTAAAQPEVLDDAASQPVAAELQSTLQAEALPVTHPVEAPFVEVTGTSVQAVATETEHTTDQVPVEESETHVQDTIATVQIVETPLVEVPQVPEVEADLSAGTAAAPQAEDGAPAEVEAQAVLESSVHEDIAKTQVTETSEPVPEHATLFDETRGPATLVDVQKSVVAAPTITPEPEEVEAKSQDSVVEPIVETQAPSVAEEAQSSPGAEVLTQILDVQAPADALSTVFHLEAATATVATQNEHDEIVVDMVETKSTPDVPTEETPVSAPETALVEDTPEVVIETNEPTQNTVTEPEPVEDSATAPATEEAQVLADSAPIASEPVAITSIVPIEELAAHDARAPIEIDQPPGAPAPQLDDEAANSVPPIVVVSAAEEIVTVEVEVMQSTADTVDEPLVEDTEPETGVTEAGAEPVITTEPVVEDAPVHVEAEKSTSVPLGVSEEVVASQPEIDEPTGVDEPQEVDDLAKPVTCKC